MDRTFMFAKHGNLVTRTHLVPKPAQNIFNHV